MTSSSSSSLFMVGLLIGRTGSASIVGVRRFSKTRKSGTGLGTVNEPMVINSLTERDYPDSSPQPVLQDEPGPFGVWCAPQFQGCFAGRRVQVDCSGQAAAAKVILDPVRV